MIRERLAAIGPMRLEEICEICGTRPGDRQASHAGTLNPWGGGRLVGLFWECFTCRAKIWKRDNPEQARRSVERRKVRMREVPGDHTGEEWAARLAQFDGCAIGAVFGLTEDCAGEIQKGHVIPVSRPDLNPTDSIENLVPICRGHNGRAGQFNLSLDEWLGEGAEVLLRAAT